MSFGFPLNEVTNSGNSFTEVAGGVIGGVVGGWASGTGRTGGCAVRRGSGSTGCACRGGGGGRAVSGGGTVGAAVEVEWV